MCRVAEPPGGKKLRVCKPTMPAKGDRTGVVVEFRMSERSDGGDHFPNGAVSAKSRRIEVVMRGLDPRIHLLGEKNCGESAKLLRRIDGPGGQARG